MNVSEAKDYFKGATKVVCLTRNKEIEIEPNTIRRSIIAGSKTIWCITKCGYHALLVDNTQQQIAKIVK